MKIRLTTMGLSLLAAATLVACGGGGGSDSGGTSTSFTGTVIDGYIEGATVCLDLNSNQTCDATEPSALSKADGSYSLDISGLSAAQVAAAHLLTNVPDSAKDADDGGKTLKEAGKAAFNLMAPASAFVTGSTISSAVISPLTTLLSHDMLANGRSLADAKTATINRMGLASGTDLSQNFVAKKDDNLITQARVVAAAIGEVKKQALAVSGTSNQDALMAALGYLQQNVAALTTAAKNGGTPTAKDVLDRIKAATQSGASLAPKPSELIDEAKLVTTSIKSDPLAMLTDGFYIFCNGCDSVGYSKFTSSSASSWAMKQYALSGTGTSASWADKTNYDYELVSGGWVQASSKGSLSVDSTGLVTLTDNDTNRTIQASGREIDLSGKQASSFPGAAPRWSNFQANTNFTFSSGAKAYIFQFRAPAGEYSLWTAPYNEVRNYTGCNNTPNCAGAVLANLQALITAFPTPANPANGFNSVGGGDLQMTFDAGGTVSLWPAVRCTGCATTKLGTAAYEHKTVNGQPLLIVNAQPSHSSPDAQLFFGAINGKVYVGTFHPTAAIQESILGFNRKAIDDMLKANSSLPALVN